MERRLNDSEKSLKGISKDRGFRVKVLESTSPKGFVILEAQNPSELSYLNMLIRNGKAMNSGDSYQVLVTLKEDKALANYKKFLKEKRGFTIEE